MKVLQLIDSLEPGGAERIAVTYANSLCDPLEASFLCTTRAEGLLKGALKDKVGYLFLKKKRTLDYSALFRLKRFVKANKIDIVQAHTTSYFFATLLKLIYPKIQLIWHEHHGNRIHTKGSDHKALYWCSKFFSKIVVVNPDLKRWCETNLATKEVIYIPNFIVYEGEPEEVQTRSNIICCLANLRDPKNHMLLLKAFRRIHEAHPDWKLQLIGKDFNDNYSEGLKNFIKEHRLSAAVTIEGSISAIQPQLQRATIGVLSSSSEGLPMALLEYGMAGLYPIATNVGYCREVISTFGAVVESNNEEALTTALRKAIEDRTWRIQQARLFTSHIKKHYSLEGVLPELLKIYKN